MFGPRRPTDRRTIGDRTFWRADRRLLHRWEDGVAPREYRRSPHLAYSRNDLLGAVRRHPYARGLRPGGRSGLNGPFHAPSSLRVPPTPQECNWSAGRESATSGFEDPHPCPHPLISKPGLAVSYLTSATLVPRHPTSSRPLSSFWATKWRQMLRALAFICTALRDDGGGISNE